MLWTTTVNTNKRLWGRGRGRFWWCPTHVGSVWVTITIITMTVIGAILSPMVVFSTGGAEHLWSTCAQISALGIRAGLCKHSWSGRLCVIKIMFGSLLTRCFVGWLWISVVTWTCRTICTGYTSWGFWKEVWPLKLAVFVFVAVVCIPCAPSPGWAVSLCKWFSTDRLGSYGDVLPSCCMPVPCGTKECLFICPDFCLGVDVRFLGFEDCAGVCWSPKMGLTRF